jgi:hypothetical protein
MSSAAIDNERKNGEAEVLNALAEQVLRTVAGIRFGSVELVIHEGRVVQIERRERLRLERQSNAEAAG